MRIRHIISLILIFCAASASAQQKKFPTEHSFGISVGATLSRTTFIPTVIQEYRVGTTFGVSYRYIQEKYFGIQAELRYSAKGWNNRLEDYPDLNYSKALHYVEMPILTHIFFGNKSFRWIFNAGPQVGYLLSDTTDSNVTGAVENEETRHHSERIKYKFDYGIVGGTGMEIRFGKNSILLEGRYYFGLGDLFPNEKKDIFETSSNQSISINLSYMFRL